MWNHSKVCRASEQNTQCLWFELNLRIYYCYLNSYERMWILNSFNGLKQWYIHSDFFFESKTTEYIFTYWCEMSKCLLEHTFLYLLGKLKKRERCSLAGTALWNNQNVLLLSSIETFFFYFLDDTSGGRVDVLLWATRMKLFTGETSAVYIIYFIATPKVHRG